MIDYIAPSVWIKVAEQGAAFDRNAVTAGVARIREHYFGTPLSNMKKDNVPYSEVAIRAAALIENLEL